MVSQPDPSPSTLTVRGPASVAASAPVRHSARSKRYNRSHAGGVSYAPQNEFPVFSHSGDVEILVRVGPTSNRYLLHRDTLVRYSGFFEASTSDEWSRAPALPSGHELARIGEDPTTEHGAKGRHGKTGGASIKGTGGIVDTRTTPKKRWRYELDSGSDDGDIPMLVQKEEARLDVDRPQLPSLFGPGSPPAAHNKPSASHSRSKSGSSSSHHRHHRSHSSSASSNHNFFRSVANLSLSPSAPLSSSHSSSPAAPKLTQAQEDLLRDYDNLFRIFYNYPPLLDGVNVADAYVQCKTLLSLADQYDALDVVGPRVDHHLLQFQSRLWKQIAKYPISYLRLGYLARSRVMFQEALIHVVGQWPAGERSLRAALPDFVLDIIEDKVDELEETVSRVEGRLFRLNLVTSRGERVTPSVHYHDWLVVSLFRQWLADHTSPQPPPPPPPSSSERPRHASSRDGRSHPPPAPLPAAIPSLASLGRAYRTLGSTNPSSYLGHDECKRFLKLTPELYSRENLRRFERRMDELKAMAREIVRPLMGSGLELDMSSSGGGGRSASDAIGYLTCTSVGNRDLPWAIGD